MTSFLPWLLRWFSLLWCCCLMRHADAAIVGDLQNPSVSLSQGTSDLNGYLMMKTTDNDWLSVCKSSWAGSYSENAVVACRQLCLGLPKRNVHWNGSLEVPAGSAMFACLGEEDSLQECEYQKEAVWNCTQEGQLWLECSGFQEMKLRLAGRDQFEQGRVEIYHDGRWGTICDRDWTISDANVVCKMYMNTYAIDAYKSTQDDHNKGHPIFIEDITCAGTEDTILDCKFEGLESMHECTHKDEVWVDCENNIIISGGQSVSASLITALSIVVLIFLLVFEYIGLRRYQRWKAERRARRLNTNVRFLPLAPGSPQNNHDQISVGGAVEFQQIQGVGYQSNSTRTLPNDNQSTISYNSNSRIVNIAPPILVEEPPPPYSRVAQNETNTYESSEAPSIEVPESC